jgi:hypothetical protein
MYSVVLLLGESELKCLCFKHRKNALQLYAVAAGDYTSLLPIHPWKVACSCSCMLSVTVMFTINFPCLLETPLSGTEQHLPSLFSVIVMTINFPCLLDTTLSSTEQQLYYPILSFTFPHFFTDPRDVSVTNRTTIWYIMYVLSCHTSSSPRADSYYVCRMPNNVNCYTQPQAC